MFNKKLCHNSWFVVVKKRRYVRNASTEEHGIIYGLDTCENVKSKLRKIKSFFATLLIPILSALALTEKILDFQKAAPVDSLLKSSFRCSIDNCRHINLLPKISLVFGRILFKFFFDCLRHKLNAWRNGFQSNKNSMLQFLDFIEPIYRLYWNFCCTLQLDHWKSFEKVRFKITRCNFAKFGLENGLSELTYFRLSNFRQNFSVNGFPPDAADVASRVSQFSKHGPFLFRRKTDLPFRYFSRWLDTSLLFDPCQWNAGEWNKK